ncbi:sensor histidine kinase [Streptomyces griseoluteus]|uniref:sensor histidine kinase n=1 Tax=Streptomyces griseoluteus TaxID=29306 RepID=UPI00380D3CF1
MPAAQETGAPHGPAGDAAQDRPTRDAREAPAGGSAPGRGGDAEERSLAGAEGAPAGGAGGRSPVADRGGAEGRAGSAGDGPAVPPEGLQVRALQAVGRQVFGFRLAMIVLAAPAALLNAAPGLGARLVGAAVVVTFMVSYVLFRDWGRFGPLLLRHPSLLAVDTLFGSLLLISAGPDTTLAYVSVCTPLLAGLLYGWRGAAVFASLQSLILLLVHATLDAERHTGPAETLLLPGLCVITGAMGSTLRNLMLRLGTATHTLTAVRARLAAAEAVQSERARLAREMHDSLAKTLHGVALASDALAVTASAATPDPVRLRQEAELVARSARRAAAESRELLSDLREEAPRAPLWPQLNLQAADFTIRTGLPVSCHRTGDPLPPLPPPTTRDLLALTAEALDNAHRHANATRVVVTAGVQDGHLRLSVHDDGKGLPAGFTLRTLRAEGHFGLLGMVERAASAGARIRIGRGAHASGTEIGVELPLPR